MSQQLYYLVKAGNIRLLYIILMILSILMIFFLAWYLWFLPRVILPTVRIGAFLLVETTVCSRFLCRSEVTKLSEQNHYMHTQAFNRCHNWVLLLPHGNILKFDWCYQLSGIGSNSLNLCKFPGRFSYGLGTRLESCMSPVVPYLIPYLYDCRFTQHTWNMKFQIFILALLTGLVCTITTLHANNPPIRCIQRFACARTHNLCVLHIAS